MRLRDLRPLFLLFLLLLSPVWADSSSYHEERGRLTFPFGTIFVPDGLQWDESELKDGRVYVGRSAQTVLVVGAWERRLEISPTEGMKLLQNDLLLFLENGASLKLEEAKTAPFPWPDSLEMKLDRGSALVGSEGENTMMIVVQGPSSEKTAVAVAASFKEDLSVRRQNRRVAGASSIHSLLGTAATLALLVGLLVPALICLFGNRRKGTAHNPFLYGGRGLVVSLVFSLLFSWFMLSRFSWVGFADYGRSLADNLVRFAFLLVVTIYFSKRWEKNREFEE